MIEKIEEMLLVKKGKIGHNIYTLGSNGPFSAGNDRY